jgi:hypothetical protein
MNVGGHARGMLLEGIDMAKSKTVQITVKVDATLLVRADKLVPHVSTERGVAVTRTDVFRSAIVAGLAALERADHG